MLTYSVILPAHNEADNLRPLLAEIVGVMGGIGQPYEIVVVDDGSTDGTLAVLRDLRQTCLPLRVLSLTQNCGQSAALDAGLRAAGGAILITLDADGQNPPQEIPRLLAALEGFDAVCGWRQDRQDSLGKRWSSRLANVIRRWVLNDGIRDIGCSLRVMRRECWEGLGLRLFRGLHRFLPALLVVAGHRVQQLPVEHRPRQRGRSHYSMRNRLLRPLLDLLAVYWMKRRWPRYCAREITGESEAQRVDPPASRAGVGNGRHPNSAAASQPSRNMATPWCSLSPIIVAPSPQTARPCVSSTATC